MSRRQNVFAASITIVIKRIVSLKFNLVDEINVCKAFIYKKKGLSYCERVHICIYTAL